MKIRELINKDLINLDLKGKNKNEVIEELAKSLEKNAKIDDIEDFIDAIMAREAEGSTGVGFGIAIPHAKSASVKEPCLVFARTDRPVAYDDSDGKADMFFMIAAPEGEENLHLQTLAKLSRKLIDEHFRHVLRHAETADDILSALYEIDDGQ